MSLSYKTLKPVRVLDPVTDVQSVKDYAILSGGGQVSWKAYTSTAISASSIQFSCPPPAGAFIVDRKQMITLPVRLTMTGTVTTTDAGFTPSVSLLNAGFSAPRAYPFSSSLDTLSVSINNDSVSINMADVVQALLHYNIDNKLKTRDYSLTPNYPDQSFNYADLHGSTRSPLAFYADGLDGAPNQRGAFPYTVVSNATVVASTGGTTATAVIDMLITEPIFLSPFYWGCHDSQGFYNVNSMDFNLTFLNGGGNRMWSHDAITPVATSVAPAATVTTNITNITMQFNAFSSPGFSYNVSQPQLLFKYIRPNLLQTGLGPNIPINYPYFEVQRYPTDIGTLAFSAGPQIFQSNNIQLNQIPRRMYILGRAANSALYSSPNLTDTYLAISNVNIQWAGQNTILSSATQAQLYMLNSKNHGDFTWGQWSGLAVNNAIYPPSFFSVPYGTTGGPLCLEFGTDIQLQPDECPGMNGQYQIQVNATFQNMDATGAHDAVPMTFYLIFVMEGVFTITGLGSAVHQLGVVSKKDVIDAQTQPGVNYRDVESVNGGDFLSGLRDFGSKIDNFLKNSKAISTLAPLVPGAGPYLSKIASNLGYGYGGCESGGVAVGGKRLTKAKLRKTLRNR
jgi:hypothetical protein